MKKSEKLKLKHLFNLQMNQREDLEVDNLSFRMVTTKSILQKNGGDIGLFQNCN